MFLGDNKSDGREGRDQQLHHCWGKLQIVSCSFVLAALTTLNSLQVLLKSDRVDALLDRLLPHGQLLFLNHRFAQSLEKEVTAYTSK